jgi:hypothetical protein
MNPIQEHELEWTVSTYLEGQVYPIGCVRVLGLRGVGHHFQ